VLSRALSKVRKYLHTRPEVIAGIGGKTGKITDFILIPLRFFLCNIFSVMKYTAQGCYIKIITMHMIFNKNDKSYLYSYTFYLYGL
jgi:hypothetical protein